MSCSCWNGTKLSFLTIYDQMERQDTTHIEFIVKLLHEDGPKEGKGST